MKKRNLIITLICIVLIIVGIAIGIWVGINNKEKPSRELNKAVDMLKSGNYKQAYEFVSNTKNEKNIRIIKELISLIMLDKMTGGTEEITQIMKESTNILYKVNLKNIDYSLDDKVNIRIDGLKDYIDVKNKIPKDLLVIETYEIYDEYFYCLEYVYNNCKDTLNKIGDKNYITEIQDLSTKMYTISVKTQSFSNNYKFTTETESIYNENKKYF